MPPILHKTDDPTRYRPSVDITVDAEYLADPTAWFVDPDISAVSAVPQKYWARPLTDPVTEMDQTAKDAVDAAEAAAQTAADRAESTDGVEAVNAIGIEMRAMIELHNKRINYLINRVIQIENALSAFMDESGNAQAGRDAAALAASQTFPQTQTAGAAVHFATIMTRDRRAAIDDFKADINAGNQDNPPA